MPQVGRAPSKTESVPSPGYGGTTQVRSRGTKLAMAAAGVAVATAITFWPVLGAKALLFDDFEYVIQNPLVQNPSWQSVKLFFSEVTLPSTVAGYYQPLSIDRKSTRLNS